MSQPLISATIVVGGAVLLQRLVYGGWLDALFGRDILQTNRAAEWLDDSLGRIADQATLGGFTAEKLHNPEQTAIAAQQNDALFYCASKFYCASNVTQLARCVKF